MYNLNELIELIERFRIERDWKQFHTPKNLAISISLEASEILEHFQWKNDEEVKMYLESHRENIAEEMADVFVYLLMMSHDLNIDLLEATFSKVKKNAEKYPVEKAKGTAKKYTEL